MHDEFQHIHTLLNTKVPHSAALAHTTAHQLTDANAALRKETQCYVQACKHSEPASPTPSCVTAHCWSTPASKLDDTFHSGLKVFLQIPRKCMQAFNLDFHASACRLPSWTILSIQASEFLLQIPHICTLASKSDFIFHATARSLPSWTT